MNGALGRTVRTARPEPPPARVRGNDWRALDVPGAAFAPHAAFLPRLGVSVVVPCYQGRGELAVALAALERQTYPRALFEVVVVDDGSEPPLDPPADSPLELRIVRQPRRGFGLARARNRGVQAARHDIVVFLDADLVAAEDLIAAHARWHHAVADAVTLGFCRYVSAADVDPAAVRAAANLAGLFAGRPFDFPWTERHMARTGDLTAPRDDLFRAVVGNNIGVRRAFFDEIGGFDEAFDRYGWEDTEFGYRAETRAAVLVPERAAMAWHQGRFAPNRGPGKRHAVAAQRALGARLIAHPDFRADGGALDAVPRTVVRIDAGHADVSRAVATAERVLAGDDGDVAVLIDPGADAAGARTLQARLGADRRVHVVPGADALERFPAAPFHVDLPPGAAFGTDLLRRLRAGLGTAAVAAAQLADGNRIRIARGRALHRARRAGGRPGDYGVAAAFRIGRREPLRSRVAALRRRLPRARRPLAGVARLCAEAVRIRDAADALRFARWLAAGLRWWIGIRLGHGRPAVRFAERPRRLAALSARRARHGRPVDLLAAARLLRAAAGVRTGFAAEAQRLAWQLRALPAITRAERRGVRRLVDLADTEPRRTAAAEIAAALSAGARGTALSIARTAARVPDLRAEKIVSRRYRFVWLANPKAASRSLIRALAAADPEAVLLRETTLAEVYAAFPEARGYFSFAFVRHPVARALSCHADKVAGAGDVALDAFHGLPAGTDLDAWCAWLGTCWGADAFADRHWLSQDVLLREAPEAPLPDFLGRFERLCEDFETVTARLGIPYARLPHLNRGAGVAVAPSKSAMAALGHRYARDCAAFGYPAAHAGAAAAPFNAQERDIDVATVQVNRGDGATDTVVYPARGHGGPGGGR